MSASGYQTGEMSHVHQQYRADRICNRSKKRKVEGARVGASAGDDHLRAMLFRELRQFVVIDALIVAAHSVGHDFIGLAGKVEGIAVGEVSSMRQIHAKHSV